MMTEQSSATQTLAERDALYPSSVEEVTTSDVILISEDAAETTPEDKVEEKYEDKVERTLNDKKHEYNFVLNFRVKNELIKQIFNDIDVDTGAINIDAVAQVIKKEVTAIKDEHFQSALYVENTLLPAAHVSQQIGISQYSPRDVENLSVRADAHLAMIEYIEQNAPSNSDGYTELSEAKIRELLPVARDEALAILIQQREEFERQERVAEERRQRIDRAIRTLGAHALVA